MMDKDQKEALQVAKELTAKLVETRMVSAGSIRDVFPNVFHVVEGAVRDSAIGNPNGLMDKDQKEALQVAKELTAKLIETRMVSAGNIGDVFPSIFGVVNGTIIESAARKRDGQQ